MKHRRNISVAVIAFSALFLFHTPAAHAAMITCPTHTTATLHWSSSNIASSGCTFTYGASGGSPSTACTFSPTKDNSSSEPVTLTSGTCTVSMSCPAGTSGIAAVPSSDTLTYQPTYVWNNTACVPPSPVNGSCGSANGVAYANGSSSYSPYAQCASGSSSNTSFPSAGNTVSWTCSGTNGGSASGTCSASQSTASLSVPTVTTSAVTSITQTAASSGGTVSSNGGSTVTQSGIALSTSANPTTANAITTDGWAIGGPWIDSITGLAAGTTYYIRAYAINGVGTAYGNDVSFTTSAASGGSCSAQTISNCTLPLTSSGSSGGSCNYSGSCNYTCSNGTWNVVSSTNSCVAAPTAPTGVWLTASPSSITNGSSSNLTWGSTGATSCRAFGGFWTGNATSNSTGVSVNPSTTSNYQIHCDNAGGSTNSNIANVTVTASAPVLSITATPTRVSSGGTSIIKWSASGSGVTSCNVTRNGGAWKSGLVSVPAAGVSDTVTGQTVYTLTCNAGSPQSVTVNVAPGFQEF
jgi:hypothetical protein